jgi:hypothetical protein
MDHISNPGSFATSDGFQEIKIITPNNYIISEFNYGTTDSPVVAAPVTNLVAADIPSTSYSLF